VASEVRALLVFLLLGVALLGMSLVTLPGCRGARTSALIVQIIAPDETNPAAGRGSGVLRVRVEQNGEILEGETDVRSERFDLIVPIRSYATPARIQVELDLERGLQIGAVPYFAPLGAGFVRVVVGAPGTCATLIEPRLPDPRIDAALVAVDANLLLFGGTTARAGGSGHDRVGVIGAIHLTWGGGYVENALDPLTVPLGATRAARLASTDRVVAISDSRTEAVLYDLGFNVVPRETVLDVHDGVGASSALVDLDTDGVAIVGGGTESAPGGTITWIDATGAISETPLAEPRAHPAAIRVGPGILIAGGQAEGRPFLEYARLRERGIPIAGTEAPVRRAPVVVRDPSRRAALVLGGEDATGQPVSETTIVTGCPDACTVAPGPVWERARLGPAIAETDRSTFLLGGTSIDPTSHGSMASAAVDEIVIVGDTVSFETFGDLDRPRARATAVHLASGLVLVVGGVGPEGVGLATFTLCWPNALEPWH
jgi:hypothetical protein